jgi:hypothetical protein
LVALARIYLLSFQDLYLQHVQFSLVAVGEEFNHLLEPQHLVELVAVELVE